MEFIIVFLRVFFLISPTARQLATAYVSSEKNPTLLSKMITQFFTALMMRLLITLIATFLHNGFTRAWFVQWITTLAHCFPLALFQQVFLAVPFG